MDHTNILYAAVHYNHQSQQPLHQLSLLYTCSNHLNLISLFNLSCPCHKLISTDIHSGHFQLTFKHLQLCHLQLNLPSFCECHLPQTIQYIVKVLTATQPAKALDLERVWGFGTILDRTPFLRQHLPFGISFIKLWFIPIMTNYPSIFFQFILYLGLDGRITLDSLPVYHRASIKIWSTLCAWTCYFEGKKYGESIHWQSIHVAFLILLNVSETLHFDHLLLQLQSFLKKAYLT